MEGIAKAKAVRGLTKARGLQSILSWFGDCETSKVSVQLRLPRNWESLEHPSTVF